MIRGLIGMVHLGPLPGSPRAIPVGEAIERAVADAGVLGEAGFDALLVENFGDSPFHPDDVPKITVAAMTRAVTAVAEAAAVPVGVNVLRNDGLAALAIAAATGASFVRVNVLAGSMETDQGPIVGRAAEIARFRAMHVPEAAVLADVMVKHAVAPPGLTIERAASDLWKRSGADGLIVSGSGTGLSLNQGDLDTVHQAVPDAPLFAGSGVSADDVAGILAICAGVLVGTSIKRQGITSNPVDPDRAAALVEAAR